MTILVDKHTSLIVQGITGREGSFYTKQMIDYGTGVMGGVTPGKGGEWVHGRPVFDSVKKAIDATGANASVIYVPAYAAPDAIYEAIDAGIGLIVCITEGIPILDMMKIHTYIKHSNSRLIGPNCPGLLVPNVTSIGIIPSYIAHPGNLGIVSRSGTLMYDIVYSLSQANIGHTICVGIGNDPIIGTNFVDILRMFEEDVETEKILLIGEAGGQHESDAADFITTHMTKPVVAYVAGKVPSGDITSRHTDVILDRNTSTVTQKIEALMSAGARVAEHPEDVPDLVRNMLD